VLFGYNYSYYSQRNILQKTIIKNNASFLFYTLLIVIHLFVLSNCSDKKKEDSNHIIDITQANTFILKSNSSTYNIALQNKKILVNNTPHPVILLNLLSPTCSTCLEHAKTLGNLENTNQKLLVVNITQSTQNKENINFTNEIYKTFDLPKNALSMLSILYINGKYYQHYEGLTPIEMIQYDIQTSNTN